MNYPSETAVQLNLSDAEMRRRPRASASEKDTEKCVMAWAGADCDLYEKRPLWGE